MGDFYVEGSNEDVDWTPTAWSSEVAALRSDYSSHLFPEYLRGKCFPLNNSGCCLVLMLNGRSS